jgi:hypothetical protein
MLEVLGVDQPSGAVMPGDELVFVHDGRPRRPLLCREGVSDDLEDVVVSRHA